MVKCTEIVGHHCQHKITLGRVEVLFKSQVEHCFPQISVSGKNLAFTHKRLSLTSLSFEMELEINEFLSKESRNSLLIKDVLFNLCFILFNYLTLQFFPNTLLAQELDIVYYDKPLSLAGEISFTGRKKHGHRLEDTFHPALYE